jgi:rRNA maturation endonuclease Nob1
MKDLKKKAIRLWHVVAYAGQCSGCGGWFDDWPGGVCSACQAIGH